MSAAPNTVKADTRIFDAITEMVRRAGHLRVRVGILEDAEHHESGESLVTIAAAHEFGVPGRVRERSFLRSTFEVHKAAEMEELLARAARALANDQISPELAYERIGLWAVGAVRASIRERLIVQDLSPATIAAKGSDAALIDTGQLVDAIAHDVVSV